jgi:uncharacterized protein (TIGR02996 family)
MTAPKSQQAAFLAAIHDDPENDGTRLVFADWLEEHGDPRAEFIRVQCALAHQDKNDPHGKEQAQQEAD